MDLTATVRQPAVDGPLIAACRAGDRDAFRQLFERYQDCVYRTALSFLHGDAASAEDVAQEVFVRLFDRLGQFRGESEFATWLNRLVINVCLDELRRRRRVAPLSEVEGELEGARWSRVPEPAPAEPHSQAERDEVAAAVHAAVGALPGPLRAAVVLKYFGDLSYEEMALALRCPPGTIASRLNRGLKQLGRRLAPFRDCIE